MIWADEVRQAKLYTTGDEMPLDSTGTPDPSFSEWSYSVGRALARAFVFDHSLEADKDHVLLVTAEEDADHFTLGIADVLAELLIETSLWCLWLDTVVIDQPAAFTASTIMRQYRDALPNSFSKAMICHSIISDPAIVRTMMCEVEELGLINPDLLPPIVDVVSAVMAMDSDRPIADMMRYFDGRARYTTAFVDRDNAVVRRWGGSPAAAFGLGRGSSRLNQVPGIVVEAKKHRPVQAKTYGR